MLKIDTSFFFINLEIMKLNKIYSSIFLIVYILLTLGFRFWLENNYQVGIIPSLLIGLIFLAIPYFMWKKEMINPYGNSTK